MNLPRLRSWLPAFLPALALAAAGADETAVLQHFRDLAETRDYTLGLPFAPRLTPDGATVIFLRSARRDPVLRLYEYDLAAGRERELVTPEQILGSGEEKLSPEERAHRERARVTLRGFTTFDLSSDGGTLLVTLSGRLHVVQRAGLAVTPLPGEGWIDPHLSPDGSAVAAVRGGELHVIDLATRADRQLTTGASATLSHGTAEFAAQEEMNRFHGFWWAPDSQSLAYQETDESAVEPRTIADPLHPSEPPQRYLYPRAGSANARVRLGVIGRAGGPTRWITWDAEKFPYLARVAWDVAGAPLTLLVQARSQQEQSLLAVDTATGATRELLHEHDAAWLNLDSGAPMPHWLPGGRQFLWTTESRGDWQVELREASGALVRELTPLGFGYRALVGATATDAWLSASADPTDAQLWRVPLAGGAPVALTHSRGVHAGVVSDNGRTLLDRFSLLDGSAGTAVLDGGGAPRGSLPSVAEQPAAWPKPELTEVTGAGRTYHAAVLRPRDFRSGRKFPVLLSVYGGPTVTVVSASARSYFKDQWLADQGYIVVRLDGRGTPHRGREWERAVRGNLIDVALQDQVDGLRALGARYPELDLDRVGVFGWSFGGYFSAMATIRRPDVFKAGVAGAPVIDWENYDTFYTERYLGLPQENPEAYRVSSVLTYAGQLERPLLVIHGLTDDNVYFQHSLQLLDALFMLGKPYEFLPMLGTHMAGAGDPVVALRREQRILDFFDTHLKPVAASAPSPQTPAR